MHSATETGGAGVFRYHRSMIGNIAAFLRSASRAERLVWLLAAVALIMTAYVLGALFFLQELFNGVCGIFWAIGQAMLNGYTLYEDIFESKPPIIFLLAALSLRLTGSPVLGTVLHTVLLAAVPAGMAWYVLRRFREYGVRSPALLAAGFLFATLIIRYLSRHPTAWAVEFYGLAALCLYFLVLADTRRFTVVRMGLLTLLLGLSVGMKESFIIVAVAGACILCRSRTAWIRGVVIPSIAAGLVGVVTLALLGSLGAYLTVYLPEMLGYYTQRYYMPFIMKGLVFDFVFGDLMAFSPLFLALCIVLLAVPEFLGATKEGRGAYERWILSLFIVLTLAMLPAVMFFVGTTQALLLFLVARGLIAVFVRGGRISGHLPVIVASVLMLLTKYSCVIFRFLASGAGSDVASDACTSDGFITVLLFAIFASALWAGFTAWRAPRDDSRTAHLLVAGLTVSLALFYGALLTGVDATIVWTWIVITAGTAILARTAWLQRGTESGALLRRIGMVFLGLALAQYAVAMGSDFQGHHFLSAVPFFFALSLPCVPVLLRRPGAAVVALAAVSMTIILNPLRHPSVDAPAQALADSRAQVAALRDQAQAIDGILDACGVERYFVMAAGDVYAFTRHTPSNYYLWAALEGVRHHPVISERTLVSVAESDIVFIGPNLPSDDKMSDAERGTLQYILSRFSEEPWSCARDVRKPEGMEVFYRTVRAGKEIPQAGSL
jgi:hypothetical protein